MEGKRLSAMNAAIKYRLYPTTEQCILFAKTFGCCRKVYNLMLDAKIKAINLRESLALLRLLSIRRNILFLKK